MIPGGIHLFDARNSLGFEDRIYSGYPTVVPNQLEWVIRHFKEKGFGNEHCWIQIGYPESNYAYDIPYVHETDRKTSPCLRGLGFRVIEEKQYACNKCSKIYNEKAYKYIVENNILHEDWNCSHLEHGFKEIDSIKYLLTKVVFRSWDLWGGWPVNMGGFTLLNEYVAGELDIEPGPLSFTSPSLHCYDFQIDSVKARIGAVSYENSKHWPEADKLATEIEESKSKYIPKEERKGLKYID